MKIFEKIKYYEQKEIDVLGLALFQYGQRNVQGVKEKYFSMFSKTFEQKFFNSILNPIYKNHDYIFIVRTAGLGEAYLLNFMIDDIVKNKNIKSPCIVTHRRVYEDMFKLFNPDIPCYVNNVPIGVYNNALVHRFTTYKGIPVQVVHSTIEESTKLFQSYAKGYSVPYPEKIKEMAKVDNYTYKAPIYSDEDIEYVNKIENLDLNNFVFIMPEANSILPLSETFWENVCNELRSKGYDIFANTKCGVYPFAKSELLTIPQAMYLASLSKGFVSIRCGLLEVLSTIPVQKHVIYTPHKFNNVSATNLINTSSLKDYPFIDKSNLYEYNTDEINEEQIIKEIVRRF